MPRHSKAKGGAFERTIARELSEWLTGGQDSTQLIRSVSSGGWTRGRKQAQKKEVFRHIGDLAPNGPKGEEFRRQFAVECKHHKRIDLYQLWTLPHGDATLTGWWEKIGKEALEGGVRPMLIFRSNGQPILVAISGNVATATGQSSPIPIATIPWLKMSIVSFAVLLQCDPNLFIHTNVLSWG